MRAATQAYYTAFGLWFVTIVAFKCVVVFFRSRIIDGYMSIVQLNYRFIHSKYGWKKKNRNNNQHRHEMTAIKQRLLITMNSLIAKNAR